MAISKDEVKYIAQLAKLHFDEDEAEKFAKEFENILQQFKTLDALDFRRCCRNKTYSICN